MADSNQKTHHAEGVMEVKRSDDRLEQNERRE